MVPHIEFAIPHLISFLGEEEYKECIFLFLGVLKNDYFCDFVDVEGKNEVIIKSEG